MTNWQHAIIAAISIGMLLILDATAYGQNNTVGTGENKTPTTQQILQEWHRQFYLELFKNTNVTQVQHMLFCYGLMNDNLNLSFELEEQAMQFKNSNVKPTEQFQAKVDKWQADSDLFDSECNDFEELSSSIANTVRKNLKF
jgi:hypothetical protein